MYTDRPTQLMAPLSARTYFDAFYDISEMEANSRGAIPSLPKRLRGCSLTPTAVLEDTWPDEGWREPYELQQDTLPAAEDSDSVATAECNEPIGLRDRAMDNRSIYWWMIPRALSM